MNTVNVLYPSAIKLIMYIVAHHVYEFVVYSFIANKVSQTLCMIKCRYYGNKMTIWSQDSFRCTITLLKDVVRTFILDEWRVTFAKYLQLLQEAFS